MEDLKYVFAMDTVNIGESNKQTKLYWQKSMDCAVMIQQIFGNIYITLLVYIAVVKEDWFDISEIVTFK